MIHVLLPAFNEAAALERLIPELDRMLKKAQDPYKIVVVNDGSNDSTGELLVRLAESIPLHEVRHPLNRGYGAALMSGYQWIPRSAESEGIVIALDADGTHGPEYVPALIAKIRDGWDMVTASYTLPGSSVTGVPAYRALLSQSVNLLFRLLCPVPNARTYSNGFRAYSIDILRRVRARFGEHFLEEPGFAGGTELFLKAASCGGRAAEIPFALRYERRGQESKIRFLPTILGYLKLMLRARCWSSLGSEKRSFRWMITLLGVALGVGFTLARAPGLYDGLWEDEIHYHASVFLSPTPHQFRADIGPIMKPFLDFAVRKWLWFSPWGFSVAEQRLALVSLLYSAFHLLAWMVLPWTPFLGLRLVAVLLLGLCSIESTYSTEAQGYSFYSLAPTLMFFTFLFSGECLRKKQIAAAFAVFLLAFFVYLNSHFFAWPACGLMLGLFAVYVWREGSLEPVEKKKWLRHFLIGCVGVILFTIVADKPGLYFLLSKTPAPLAGYSVDWKATLGYLNQAWSWLNLPSGLFLLAAFLGLVHPQRSKRYAAWGAVLTIFLAKYFLVTAMTMKSAYGIADRYLIMFIAPSLLAFVLGIESLAIRCQRWMPRSGAVVTTAALAAVCFGVAGASLRDLGSRAGEGLARMRAMPADYSSNFQFFERVKAYQSPVLILTNHCWASDIPRFYMEKAGARATAPFTILNTSGDCETPPSVLPSKIHDFMTNHRESGKVAFFYEGDRGTLIPCGLTREALYRRPLGACVGIVSAKTETLSQQGHLFRAKIKV